MINCAPSVFYPLLESDDDTDFARLHSLRVIILGGEPIRTDKLLPWVNSVSFHGEIINTYGPTECTDIASILSHPQRNFPFIQSNSHRETDSECKCIYIG